MLIYDVCILSRFCVANVVDFVRDYVVIYIWDLYKFVGCYGSAINYHNNCRMVVVYMVIIY